MPSRVIKKGNHWYYRIQRVNEKGELRWTERAGGRTKREALEAYFKAAEKIKETGCLTAPSEMSLEKLINIWLEDYVELNLHDQTVKNYKSAVKNHILTALGYMKICKINTLTIQKFINSKVDYSYGTIDHLLIVLKSIFHYAIAPCEYLIKNPCEGVRVPQNAKDKTEVHVFSRQDIKLIFQKFPEGHHYDVPLRIAYHTGLRIGEALGLHWQEIDLEYDELTVKGTMTESGVYQPFPKNKTSKRTIPFGRKLHDILIKEMARQEHLKSNYEYLFNRENYVCCRDDGSRISTGDMRFFNMWCTETFGKGHTAHSLRHTHATMLLEAGETLDAVSKRLGHSTVVTTSNTYSHMTKNRHSQTVSILNQIL